MKKLIISGIIFLSLVQCSRQQETFISERTTSANRKAFHGNLIQNTIESALKSDDLDKWQGAFWGMGLAQFRSDVTDHFFNEKMDSLLTFDSSIQRGFLEVIYGLYPQKYQTQILSRVNKSENIKNFAMMCHYIIRYDTTQKQMLHELLSQKFDLQDNPGIYISLEYDLIGKDPKLPPLETLVTHNFKNKPVIFSFHRKNRAFQGLTMVRSQDGHWISDEFGRIFSIPHLARSCSDLPPYITHGNSPQGLYAITGTGKSENVFIGPSESLQLSLPFETTPADFGLSDTDWTETIYRSLLPDEWQSYFAIMGTYFSGLAGRSEIMAHGTTINPDYYQHLPFYPNTLSLGCMTATEIWDNISGKLVHSDQQALIKAWKKLNADSGYFILVEIDDKEQDVTLQEILKIILRM